MHPILYFFLIFFALLDPIGNVPFFASLLKHFPPAEQRRVIWRELAIVLFLILLFLYCGPALLLLFHFEMVSLQIAGGVILFIIALKMTFSSLRAARTVTGKHPPFIVPLAIPAVCGPGLLSTILLLAAREDKTTLLLALLLAWAATTVILLLSSQLRTLLGLKGLIALERLVGFFVVLLAVDMTLKGIVTYSQKI